jgi:Ca2+ transporting ATPase
VNLKWIAGVIILGAVLAFILLIAFNDWRRELQFRNVQSKLEKEQQTSVIRDDHIQQIPVSELVVGDLCLIKQGKRY